MFGFVPTNHQPTSQPQQPPPPAMWGMMCQQLHIYSLEHEGDKQLDPRKEKRTTSGRGGL